jgi:hypothetical protein
MPAAMKNTNRGPESVGAWRLRVHNVLASRAESQRSFVLFLDTGHSFEVAHTVAGEHDEGGLIPPR